MSHSPEFEVQRNDLSNIKAVRHLTVNNALATHIYREFFNDI